MTYRAQLRLYFEPSAFICPTTTNKAQRSPRKPHNAPISLTYIADADEHHPAPLTTEKRFFLQIMRAHLQCLTQRQTPIKDLLDFVSGGWNAASAVSEALRRLNLENTVDVDILADERLGVQVGLLLPKVQTKVVLSFEVSAHVDGEGSEDGGQSDDVRLRTGVDVQGKVVYGEQYKEGKMGEFVRARIGGDLKGAQEAVRDLKARLVATGRKGVTV